MSGRRSLRSRLTLLIAVAVALAIAACAGTCWFIVRDELYAQVNRSLQAYPRGAPPGEGPPRERDVSRIVALCAAGQSFPAGGDGLRPFLPLVQVVYPDGRRCLVGQTAVTVTEVDQAVASGAYGHAELRDGVTDDGDPVRVRTQNVAPGVAVMESRSLVQTESTLTWLAGILSGVAALGVLGAALAGLLISRTALRPVERLTGVVEHIARTEDLDTAIPVEGTDEIARLSTSFNAMTAALAGSRDRQRRLIADAGHELRTPLTSLRTNIDLLLRSEHTGRALDPAAKERLLVNVKAQFEELSTLVGDLLQLSRGESDHEPHVEFAFHEVVGAAVERARLRGAEVGAELDPWYVEGNPASLERAVLNLLDNAAKFSPGQVEVRLRAGELTVRDHGPGIPADELPYVFERFWRSPSARSLPGSGLGLAIVAQTVSEAGGQVRLGNAEGGGVVASLSLPGTAHP
ncbi:sensor histidine kinase [Streptosporangium sp. NBC_01756]|uniref:sensor histidine kinase n=1 Tax=Streptosporangium sp. NBC_01756 TaxID=2975950 RepID=UPI002DDBAC08|nr:HAMP domain-containing sensor histidine kinase [Streptosporangium sp. NBC_01756]WSC87529.1 HAMP domain-containing histidine kinase [Streptosporangium sp. NBC_01756]